MEDDCCEPPCTPDHPCAEGEGHCEVDADCQVQGVQGLKWCVNGGYVHPSFKIFKQMNYCFVFKFIWYICIGFDFGFP